MRQRGTREILWALLAMALAGGAPSGLSADTVNRGPLPDVNEIIFAVRKLGDDPHWYANFGPTLDHSRWRTYHDGARLCRLNLITGECTVLLDDPTGGIRDPAVDYDGKTIVFAYRPGGTTVFHLYRILSDGSGLTQLTDGAYDDIEPAWLPNGGIVFVSARCRRSVNCHTTDTAVLYRCEADGSNMRPLSSNNEPDNTPWPLPNGQILYTRWEYVDRNQLSFHHLWTANPDGTRQTVFFGNMHPGTTMIDAKPIPGSPKIVASFSPGHGLREHDGTITLVDPRHGPDQQDAARPISLTSDYRDPWPFSEDCVMAARRTQIVVLDGRGQTHVLYQLPVSDAEQGFECHEPRPLITRPRERIVAPLADWSQQHGRLILADVYQGRDMEGVQRGEIKKLLVLETLPKPINYTGGMEPMSYGGTFTLERVLGTVPVEPDGSAHFELPALRSLFFVALDENELSVKRMQSFLTVMPGETVSCVGCHEPRSQTPSSHSPTDLMALRRAPSTITPVADVPDVIDYPRDIQPILDEHCVRCHDDMDRQGGISLSGDRGPLFSISYFTMTAKELVLDGRNGMGNRPPRSIGSGGSRLMQFVDGSHFDARPTETQRRLIRLWIDSGAAYPGTYAALGTGMIGGFEIVDRSIQLDRSDTQWPETQAAMRSIERRCLGCHGVDRPLPVSVSHKIGPGGWGAAFDGEPPWVDLTPNDLRRRWSRHLMYNLTRPDRSLILRAPLARAAGGQQRCGTAVFDHVSDPDYQTILAAIARAGHELHHKTRFDMPHFQPRVDYIRRMQRYGILPTTLEEGATIDVFALEQAYWQSLWFQP